MTITGAAAPLGTDADASLPEPHLYLAFNGDRPLDRPMRYRLGPIERLTLGRGTARGLEPGPGPRSHTLRIPDGFMSSSHAHLERRAGRSVLIDAGSKNGVVVNGIRQPSAVLADGDLVELGRTLFLYRDAVPTAGYEPLGSEAPVLAPETPELCTFVPSMQRELDRVVTAADSLVPVLVLGETGTGKEVAARAIHRLSRRRGAFVPVNCGALPDTLLEAELFGAQRGAYSGADRDRPGLVRSADQGTLFLDEIGDLPRASQVAFLRVLQEREVTPIGASRAVPVDFRLVSATHRPLDALVADGAFRADLLARLNGVAVHLVPLSARREDLGLLIAALIRRHAPDPGAVSFDPVAARALFTHDWPLNVRELERAIQGALALARGAPIGPDHLPEAVRRSAGTPAGRRATPASIAPQSPSVRTLEAEPTRPDEPSRERLLELLAEHRGNVSAIARVTGKGRTQVHRWIKKHGLETWSFRR